MKRVKSSTNTIALSNVITSLSPKHEDKDKDVKEFEHGCIIKHAQKENAPRHPCYMLPTMRAAAWSSFEAPLVKLISMSLDP